jgi:hypothetical protein
LATAQASKCWSVRENIPGMLLFAFVPSPFPPSLCQNS